MGRRNRSKRNSGEEDDDGLERAEMEWLVQRQSAKRQKVEDNDVPSSVDCEKSKDTTSGSTAPQKKSKDDVSTQSNNPKKTVSPNENSSEKDRTEKTKLKKQRQKERQREKKRRRETKEQASKPVEDEVVPSSADCEKSKNDTSGPTAPQKKSKDDGSTQSNNAKKSTSPIALEKHDKIEKLKLKKQKQKERQRVKKEQAASAADAIKLSREKSQKALQSKQKQEREKKATMKETQSQQKFATLGKGVKYLDLVVGKGPAVQHRKKVRVSYTLRAKSHTSGKILDSSNNFGFRVGKGEVIKGWDIGLQDMRVGGVRRLVVAPSAGYGNKDVGAGGGSDLYFQIELLHVAP